MSGFKERLLNGETVIGTFLSLGNATTTEIISNAGFDWVVIDLEHGLGAENDVLFQLMALEKSGVTAIVRVEGHQRQRIHRVLDFGAKGIMCPRVETPADVLMAIKAMRYPPQGIRGVARMVRAAQYGEHFDTYRQSSIQDLLGVIQIETTQALDHLDEIAATDGVDVLFIGPSDLTMALGIFGQTDHPVFLNAVGQIIAAARKAGKQVGILLADSSDMGKYHELGVRFFACGTDAGFLSKAAKKAAADMRNVLTQVGKQ